MNTAKRILSALLCLCMLMPLAVTGVWADGEEPERENVALGKAVDATSGSNIEAIVDGNVGSFWDSTSGRTTSDSTVTVDLGAWYKLEEVTVVNYHGDNRYYHYTVAVSADGEKYTQIGDKNDKENGGNKGITFPSTGESVRYIRVNLTKNSANPEYHINEIMAYGELDADYKPPVITVDPDDANNIAIGKPTRANYNSAMSSRVTDGKLTNYWKGNAYPQYVDVDLMANYDISEIIVFMPSDDQYTFTVYTSLDGVRFDTAAESNVKKTSDPNGEKFVFDTPINARVIRVNVTSAKMGGAASVCEIKVHGKENNSAVTPTRDKITFTTYDEWLKENHGVDTSKLKDENGNYDIADTYTEKDTLDALAGLVSRVLGDKYNDWFEFDVKENTKNDYDYFEISGGGSAKVKIVGNDGVAIASGLNHYLKYYCNVNVSQQTKQVAMPASAPKVDKTIRKQTVCEVRYAYNYCTLSYTMQFYGYNEWQKELDYLMLSGVNVILDTTASEALWVAYLQQYGYTAQEAIDFVCGYAFKAWWLMGNLENYGGSVGDQWMYDTLEMARVNQRYMTVMGCMPCLNIFAGTLPTNFAVKADAALTQMGFANVKDYMTSTGGWCGFTRPYAMNTTFPGFEKMTIDFYETQNNLYGQITDYYAGDFLHEISGGFQLDPAFDKANMSRTVLDYLLDENDEACWIMQSWWENPLPEVVAGFGEDREDHVLMLDLAAVQDPRWQKTDRFGGKEFGGSGWVYCMLDNYGGRTGMHGAFNTIVTGLLKAYKEAKHFKGIGITPEGTEENPASYDFYWEMAWMSLDDVPAGQTTANFAKDYIAKWVENYAKRRYGTDSQNVIDAWKLLSTSVYGKKTVDNTSTNGIITSYPHFFESDGKTIAFGGGYYHVPYNEADLERATNMMLKDFDALKDKETYVYDVCDMMCQLLTNSSTVYFDKMGQAILDNDRDAFTCYKAKYLRCIELIDEVTACVDDTMLGNWVGRIDDWVNDERTGDYADYDVDTMKYNTLTLITTWASHASLVGYANREYSGLMNDYYLKIWSEYLNRIDGKAVGKLSDVQSNNTEYFQYAWDIIVSKGEGYTREVSSAAGGNGTRSLVQIYSEIVRKLLSNAPVSVNKILSTGKSEDVKILGKQLRGLPYGILSSEVGQYLKSQAGGKITVLDANGNPLGKNVYLHDGCTVVLKDEDGMTLDALNVGGMKGGMRVEFEKETETVKAGKKVTLKATYVGATTDDKVKLVFTSSDTKIATVDANGVVKGISEGTVTITVTAGEYTDTIEVTVTPRDLMPIIAAAGGALVLIVAAAIAIVVLKKKKKKA